jgi:sigma-E factor negative regulatory protein RseC
LALESGEVMRVNKGTALVKTSRTEACKSCASKGSCHTSGQEMEVEAINLADAREGDTVVMSMQTASLLKISFLLYILPVLLLIIGAAAGNRLGAAYGINESVMAAAGGFLLFLIAFIFIVRKGNRMARKDDYRPKIIRVKGRPTPLR